jgi:hypothetical protein
VLRCGIIWYYPLRTVPCKPCSAGRSVEHSEMWGSVSCGSMHVQPDGDGQNGVAIRLAGSISGPADAALMKLRDSRIDLG